MTKLLENLLSYRKVYRPQESRPFRLRGGSRAGLNVQQKRKEAAATQKPDQEDVVSFHGYAFLKYQEAQEAIKHYLSV